MDNIILLGGVFDPVHIGHLLIYKTIKKHLQFKKFIIIPSKNPPLKDHQPYAPIADRINMLKLLFGRYRDIEISTHEVFVKNKIVSYTIDTLKYFHKKYPNAHLYFVIGSDRYLDFKQWKSWRDILQLVKLLVVKRNHKKIVKSIPATFLNVKPIMISSSQLRIEPNNRYLTTSVSDYISSHGLYISNQIRPLLSFKRYEHTLRVAKLAVELTKAIAPKLIKKAYIAAMYHDIAKEFSQTKIKSMIEKWDKKMFPTIHTMHGLASAIYAQKFFNIKDPQILDAVSYHVIPNVHSSTLTMIIYCADKLEPARTKKDVSNRLKYIKLAKHNLKLAFTMLKQEMSKHYN